MIVKTKIQQKFTKKSLINFLRKRRKIQRQANGEDEKIKGSIQDLIKNSSSEKEQGKGKE